MLSAIQQNKKHNKRTRLRRFCVRTGSMLFVVGLLAATVLLLPHLQLTTISVSGVEHNSAMRVHDYIIKNLQARLFGIFPKNNILLIKRETIKSEIETAFPRFLVLNLSRSLKNGILVDLTERAEWGIYCKANHQPCFYIDTTGTLFEKAPQLTGNIIFRITDYRSIAEEPEHGLQVISFADVEEIRRMRVFLEDEFSIRAEHMIFDREYEGDRTINTNEGWYIRWDNATRMEQALENLRLVLQKHLTSRVNLEYVDIRFAEKIFYKENE